MRIILHFGMIKTGSSSIQATLAKNAASMSNSNIYYPIASYVDHNGILTTAFSQKPRRVHKLKEISRSAFEEKKAKQLIRLDKLLKAHQGRDILLSSEVVASLRFDELKNFYLWLKNYTDDITAVAYVRSPATHLASAFQQQVKGGLKKSFDLHNCYPYYKHTIEKFDSLFGKENVQLWQFNPASFPEGGVVTDFCQRLGINMPLNAIVRVNEGLSLPAISLLYAYSKLGQGIGSGKNVRKEYQLLVKAVSQLQGEKLQFSARLIRQTLRPHRDDIAWVEARLGTPFSESIPTTNPANAIRSEKDLLSFTPQTLEWLATEVGVDKVSNKKFPRMIAQDVAKNMHLLRLKLAKDYEESQAIESIERRKKRTLLAEKRAKMREKTKAMSPDEKQLLIEKRKKTHERRQNMQPSVESPSKNAD